MGILSKAELIRRIMIGEMLINPSEEELIVQNLLNHDSKKAEELLEQYFEKVGFDRKTLTKRKLAIKHYAENYFKDKNAEEIVEYIKDKFKGIKNREVFRREIKAPIFIDYFDPECLQMANYDLELGEDVYVTTEKVPTKLNAMGKDGVVAIEPGEFGILMTYEYIFVPPDLMGFISVRLTHKQKGLEHFWFSCGSRILW
jgi:hypothetical protein